MANLLAAGLTPPPDLDLPSPPPRKARRPLPPPLPVAPPSSELSDLGPEPPDFVELAGIVRPVDFVELGRFPPGFEPAAWLAAAAIARFVLPAP